MSMFHFFPESSSTNKSLTVYCVQGPGTPPFTSVPEDKPVVRTQWSASVGNPHTAPSHVLHQSPGGGLQEGGRPLSCFLSGRLAQRVAHRTT